MLACMTTPVACPMHWSAAFRSVLARSAMVKDELGDTIDIHGGGLDLVFPHHENEIAQSECCHGKPMVKYWMHNGLLRAAAAGKVGGRAEREREQATSETKMSRREARTLRWLQRFGRVGR